MLIRNILVVWLFSLIFTTGISAKQYSNIEYLNLEQTSGISVSKQIEENSLLIKPFYFDELIKTNDYKYNNKIRKVHNECEVGLCGLKILKDKYYFDNNQFKYQGKDYKMYFELDSKRIQRVFLTREIDRKEYSLPKNRKDTLFEYFNKSSNLLKESRNSFYTLQHCYNGDEYLLDNKFETVIDMNTACNKIFLKNIKKATYRIEKKFKEMFYINNKSNLSKEGLKNLVMNRGINYPFRRKFKVSIICSAYNYCVEMVEVENEYAEFIKNNFMVYENEVFFKDLDLLKQMKEEKKKIQCNSNHMEEGLNKNEISERIICGQRKKIFDYNILYALKINRYNKEHADFSLNIKYRNFYKKIEKIQETLDKKFVKYSKHQRRELEMELNEYKYLLSLINIYPPKLSYNFFKNMTNEEIFNKEYDLNDLNDQITFSKQNIEKYKREKVQYLIDMETTRLRQLKRIKQIKF